MSTGIYRRQKGSGTGVGWRRAWLCLSVVALVLSGCTPKRIMYTEPPAVEPPVKTTAQAHGESSAPTTDNVSLGIKAAELARMQLGKQYQWGAAGPDRFDCSGLVFYVYGTLGVALPRVSDEQATVGAEVSTKRLQPGDLLFFALDGPRVNHVGIYLGSRKFIHAPRRYQPVRINSLDDAYWRHSLVIARRINPVP